MCLVRRDRNFACLSGRAESVAPPPVCVALNKARAASAVPNDRAGGDVDAQLPLTQKASPRHRRARPTASGGT